MIKWGTGREGGGGKCLMSGRGWLQKFLHFLYFLTRIGERVFWGKFWMKSYVKDCLDYFVILSADAPREKRIFSLQSLGNELVRKLEKIASDIVLCQKF